jgi:thiamine biosynthesis protein ThiS
MMSAHIRIIVNGFEETVVSGVSIATVIQDCNEQDRDLIVEHNGRFVYPAEYGERLLQDGDRLEFINPNFGG